jgi:hypothetical protein
MSNALKNPYSYDKKEDLFYAESKFVAAKITKADFLSHGIAFRYIVAFIYVPLFFIASCAFFVIAYLFLTLPFATPSENPNMSLRIVVGILCILGAVAAALTGRFYLKQAITASKWFRKNLHSPRKPLSKKQKAEAKYRRIAMGVIGIIMAMLALALTQNNL